jgi:flagellar FliL protein
VDQPPSPKRSKKKLILLAVLGTLLIVGGGLTYLFLTDDPGEASALQPAEVQQAGGATMVLEPFLVNLADLETRRYLKIKMEVEVEGEKVIKELEKSVPRIRDALILLLASKTYSDLGTADGKLRLKEEILQQLAKVPGGKKIRNVFFTEFVAQ